MKTFHNKDQNKSWKFRFGTISFLAVLILLTSLSFILAVIVFLRSPAKENESHLPPVVPPSVPIPTSLSNNNLLDVSSLLELFTPKELNSDGFMPLDDFFGSEEIKDKLKDYIHRWTTKNKKKYNKITRKKLGLPFPMGIIFYGPPGTGKTTLAEAFAKDSKMNFYPITNAHSLKEIEDIWRKARNNSPSCIFVDEAEEILKSRAEKNAKLLEDGDSKKTNTFLQEIEGVKTDKERPVFFIAATNHLEKIDSAIRSRCDSLYVGNQPEDKRLDYVRAVIDKIYQLQIETYSNEHYIPIFVHKINIALRNPELFATAIKHGYYIPALGSTEIKGISDEKNPNGNLETLDDKLKRQELLSQYARANNQKIDDLYKDAVQKFNNEQSEYKILELEDTETWKNFLNQKENYLKEKKLPYDIYTLEKVIKYFYDLTSGRKINAMMLKAAEKAVLRATSKGGSFKIEITDLEETFREYFGNQKEFAEINQYCDKIKKKQESDQIQIQSFINDNKEKFQSFFIKKGLSAPELTPEGITAVNKFFKIKNILDPKHIFLLQEIIILINKYIIKN
ncbi:AAA family ATPase [Candidatus Phytoplasma rubi]|uniref:AAA family ATPase n=1 Tax=Candidatus Phytoplasma rubi TaxID=399025 RepID=A0ABY7BU58_9MOLU|nr:AAA family ATPase [Candidatus Phytoplasma rubi]WAN63425.1 AAA family ATPase [Candidatus Phytoplasma rubi]